MKAQDHPVHVKNRAPDTGHIHFLEHQQRYLESLTRRLNSYHCIPKTSLQYEMIEGLKSALNALFKENDLLISSFRNKGANAKQHYLLCEKQFAKVMELEAMVLNYIREATRQD